MKFYGTNLETLQKIADELDLTIENARQISKNCVAVKLTPRNSDHKYARRTAHGRRVKACSYEAFRDFVLSAFANGATKVNTIDPRVREHKTMDKEEFEARLDEFACLNVGSRMCPVFMGDLSNDEVPETVVKLQ